MTALLASRHRLAPLRTGAVTLAIWLAFFGVQSMMSAALAPKAAEGRLAIAENDVVLAALWASFTLVILAWHRVARATARSIPTLVLMHLPLFLAATVIDAAVSRLTSVHLLGVPRVMPFAAEALYYADFDMASYLLIVAIGESLLVRRALLERQRLATRLETSLGRARLDYLEAQLHPHFLFNSLGAVSELAFDSPATAARVLRQLAAIFRTALTRKGDEITLGDEVVGIEPYLDIQRIRFADWLTIDYEVDGAALDCLLPRFVLQPLVENAIRHGLSDRRAAGTIAIAATLRDDELVVRVSDNGVGLEHASASAGHGIGLSNVRDRLAILYGDDERLRLVASASGGAVAELRIPIRRRGSTAAPAATPDADVISIARTELRTLAVPAWLSRPWLAIPCVWIVCGLLWSQQSYLYLMARDRLGGSSMVDIVSSNMVSAAIWAAITPLVLGVTTLLPVRRPMVALKTAGYVVMAAAVTLLHLVVRQRLTLPDMPISSPVWQLENIVGFLISCLIILVGHRRLLVRWLHDRERAASALGTELAAAQARAEQLQGIPRVLLDALDGIAETVRRDAESTERQLARLADYLRLALEATDARGITPDRARALDAAVRALCDSGALATHLTLTA